MTRAAALKAWGTMRARGINPALKAWADLPESDEELMEIEEARLEREFARDEWTSLRDSILAEGGIKPACEDYDIPVCLRRRGGLALDDMATLFDYSYEQEFVDHLGRIFDHYRRTHRQHFPRFRTAA